MDDKITILLREYGLDEREIRIYLSLVGKKETTAYQLSKMTKIHKSTCYDVLNRLIAKGFVSEVEVNGTKMYLALDVNQTVAKLRDREGILMALLPEIERVKSRSLSSVSVMESRESQKQFNFNLLQRGKRGEIKELYILSGGPAGFTDFGEPIGEGSSQIFLENVLEEARKSKLFKKKECKGIWNSNFKGTKLLNIFNRLCENRFIDDLPTKATVVIHDDSVAFLFTLSNIPQVIEIHNSLIAEEMKSYFKNLWKSAKR